MAGRSGSAGRPADRRRRRQAPAIKTRFRTSGSESKSLDFDEDAFAGAFLGGLDNGFFLTGGNDGEAFGTLCVALGRGVDLVAFLHVGETVVEEGEDVWRDLFAEAVAGAQILVDPDLHGGLASSLELRPWPGGHYRWERRPL